MHKDYRSVFFDTHNISHFTITHNNQALLDMTEFIKHGAENDNGYNKYHEYIHKLSHNMDYLVANFKPLLYIMGRIPEASFTKPGLNLVLA